jgi:hypothetical protein
MSRTIKAIERHMIPRSTIPRVRLGLQPCDPKLVAQWQHGSETFFERALRRLRLVFAPSPLAAAATTDR